MLPTASPFEGSEINLRFTLGYVWDTNTLQWIKDSGTGGGGGGAVTVADGADAAEGATTDAAIVTDTTGTVSGKLRGLVKWAFERMPASLGQKAMVASLPVVIASDQASVPVSAAALPLPSGAATLAAQTQPGVDIGDVTINNAAGASAVNIQDGGNTITVDGTVAVSGSVAVTGPLTDTQLRASAVPVSMGVTDLTPSSPTAATVGVASAQAVAAAATRKGLVLVNTSNARISFGFGSAAVLDSGITLYPGGVFEMDSNTFDVGAVNAIASAAASNLSIQEYLT